MKCSIPGGGGGGGSIALCCFPFVPAQCFVFVLKQSFYYKILRGIFTKRERLSSGIKRPVSTQSRFWHKNVEFGNKTVHREREEERFTDIAK